MHNTPLENFKGLGRASEMVRLRALYCFIGRQMGFPVIELGRAINRDHTAVTYFSKKISEHIDETKAWFQPELKERVDLVREGLKARLICNV